MKHNLSAVVIASLIIGGTWCPSLVALDTVTWGGGNGRWEDANWTKNSISGLSAAAAMGDNTGGRGGMNIIVGGGSVIEVDHNNGNTVLGDYNKSSVIDAADYVAWRNTGGLSDDYTKWRTHFGQTAFSGSALSSAESASAAIPEPATSVLLVIGVGLGCRKIR